MLTDVHKQAISRSWRLVSPIQETAADLFYRRLFELEPRYRELFATDLSAQKRKFLTMLHFIVRSLDWHDDDWRHTVQADEDLFLVVLALGRRHSELYSVPDEAYETVGDALMWTLDYSLGEAFTAEVREAWQLVLKLLSTTMKMGRAAKDMGTALDPHPPSSVEATL